MRYFMCNTGISETNATSVYCFMNIDYFIEILNILQNFEIFYIKETAKCNCYFIDGENNKLCHLVNHRILTSRYQENHS